MHTKKCTKDLKNWRVSPQNILGLQFCKISLGGKIRLRCRNRWVGNGSSSCSLLFSRSLVHPATLQDRVLCSSRGTYVMDLHKHLQLARHIVTCNLPLQTPVSLFAAWPTWRASLAAPSRGRRGPGRWLPTADKHHHRCCSHWCGQPPAGSRASSLPLLWN